MGIRETQIFGLNEDADRFLSENAKRGVAACPSCGQDVKDQILKREYGSAESLGMFDDGPRLYEYQLTDGRKAREVVQADPWSSGPCIFLCLEIDGQRVFEWPADQIAAA
jgi:hypothetical protein